MNVDGTPHDELMCRLAAEKEFKELCASLTEGAGKEVELSEYFDICYESMNDSA